MKQFFEEMTQTAEATAMLIQDAEQTPEPTEERRVPVPTNIRPYYRGNYWIDPEEVRSASIQLLVRRRICDKITVKAKKARLSRNEYINQLVKKAITEKAVFTKSPRTLDSKNRRIYLKTTPKMMDALREQAYQCRISINDFVNQVLEADIKENE